MANNDTVISISTYILITLYTCIICLCIYFIFVTDENIFTKADFKFSYTVLQTETENIREVAEPAFQQMKKVIKERANRPVIFGVLAIFIITWLLMRTGLRRGLDYYRFLHDQPDETQRTIIVGQLGKRTNFISSTVFTGSYLKVGVLSFFYGGLVYLSQRIQVWCLAIGFVQLFMFSTGKSFIPLLLFTIFMSFVYAGKQLMAWKNDREKNQRLISLNKKRKYENTVIRRGDIRPGHFIDIKVGEEVPCDMIIVNARVENQSNYQPRRIIFFMNEVQVTGESTPVRKLPIAKDMKIEKIEIKNLEKYEAIINGTKLVDETNIAFANSVVMSETPGVVITGIACWVGTEAKALRQPARESYKQPSPFNEYTTKGFMLSVLLLLVISTFNSLVAYFDEYDAAGEEKDQTTKLSTVWVNHVMYLNMMVPQAMEQLRLCVTTMLSLTFRSGVNCNDPLAVDVLGYVTRLVSDKTGTLTENKMVSKIAMLYPPKSESPILVLEDDLNPKNVDFIENAYAVFSTANGMEPEEVAIRQKLKHFATLEVCEPPRPDETVPGDIHFKTYDGKEVKLIIHVSFGFQRRYLCKASLFEEQSSGNFYVGVQAGGDEFWNNPKLSPTEANREKLSLWDEAAKKFPSFQGAPRIWSHGLKKLTKQKAEQLKRDWQNSWNINDLNQRAQEQDRILIDALSGVEITSKTYMIDAYRKGVVEGIKKLTKSGKQIFMCTGDSYHAAKVIADQLQFPSNHMNIDGSSEETLLNSLKEALKVETPHTFFFDLKCIELLRNIERLENGFNNEIFELLFALLEKRLNKKEIYMHFGVFSRMTPDLKPYVIKLMQERHAETLYQTIFWKRHYVLAIGDGANDINMLKSADASVGILSGETKDVCSQASFWYTEWAPIVDLLLIDAPEKVTMISMLVKVIFLKHWMTAFILWFDLIYLGFPLAIMDPVDPMLMMVQNFVVFSQIISHTSSDTVSNRDVKKKKNIMSMKAFLRWALAAILSGFGIHLIVRWLFQNASRDEFAAMIQVGQAASVTVYLIMSTNVWSDEKKSATSSNVQQDQKTKKSPIKVSDVYVGVISIVVGLFALLAIVTQVHDFFTKSLLIVSVLAITGYPASVLIRILNKDSLKIKKTIKMTAQLPLQEILKLVMEWSHTIHGRLLPIILFTLVIKVFSGVELIALIIIEVLVSGISAIIFLLVISRMGFVRALFDGKLVAVSLISLLIGIGLGRMTCSEKILKVN